MELVAMIGVTMRQPQRLLEYESWRVTRQVARNYKHFGASPKIKCEAAHLLSRTYIRSMYIKKHDPEYPVAVVVLMIHLRGPQFKLTRGHTTTEDCSNVD